MNPLMMINWHKVNQTMCAILWVVAFVLLIVVLVHAFPGHDPHTTSRVILRH